MNSDCDRFPSLLVSAASKSVTTDCTWVLDRLPDLVESSRVHLAVQSAWVIFVALGAAEPVLGDVVLCATAAPVNATARAAALTIALILATPFVDPMCSSTGTEHQQRGTCDRS